MTYAIVNYHYIRAHGHRGIRPCAIARFHRQLRWLRAHFALVSPTELYERARSGQGGRFAALTFDDALAEHARIVVPALREAGAVGAFFPQSLPFIEGKLPPVHKLHIILGRISTLELALSLERFSGGRVRVPRDRPLNPARRFDDLLTANLKETLISLPYEERVRFLDTVSAEILPDESVLVRETFMTERELVELAAAGMEIGAHTVRHAALDTLDQAAQREEIRRGTEAIAGIVGRRPRLFAYPHGRYNHDTLRILAAEGFWRAFTLGARDVAVGDGPFEIPRYDTNDLPIAAL